MSPFDPSTASASKTHIFPGVTLQALERLRDQAGGNYALKLDPDGVGGLLTTHTPMGDVVLRFDHDSERDELKVTIVKKPMLLPAAVIVTETSQVLRHAAGLADSPASDSGPSESA
jgi:hypothetical protein